MGRGRARAVVVAALGVLALALALAGCGAQSHPNDPRPEGPVRISVTVTPKAVTVTPGSIGVNQARNQQIPQNKSQQQPRIVSKEPLDVIFVTANQTRTNSHLEIHGTKAISSTPVYANSPASFQAKLPTGSYVIAAAGVPGAKPAHLVVGPYRASSQNDVLLP